MGTIALAISLAGATNAVVLFAVCKHLAAITRELKNRR